MYEARPVPKQQLAAARGAYPPNSLDPRAQGFGVGTSRGLRPLRLGADLERPTSRGTADEFGAKSADWRHDNDVALRPQVARLTSPSIWPPARPPISRTSTAEHSLLPPTPSPLSAADWPMSAVRPPPTPYAIDAEAGLGQAQLLGVRRATPRLSTNLQRRSLIPATVLVLEVLSKLPVLYGGQLAGRGLHADSSLLGAGIGVIAAGMVLNGALVALGIYDTVSMKPTFERDPRLQYLSKRGTIIALGVLAFCAPIGLGATTVAFNQAVLGGDKTRANWLRLPAAASATAHVLAASPLYTVMQTRRGWTPLKLRPLPHSAAAIFCSTIQLQFGVSGSATHIPPQALVPVQYVPYLMGILITAQAYSWFTNLSLQRGLDDTTRSPWEPADRP